MKPRATNDRRSQLARIHILAGELGFSREEYEDVVFTITRQRSAGALDLTGRLMLIEHLSARVNQHVKPRTHEWSWVDRASPDKQPMLRKLIAILRAAQPPRQRGYADAMCKTMFGIERLELVAPDQLHKLIAALMKDQARRAAREIANA